MYGLCMLLAACTAVSGAHVWAFRVRASRCDALLMQSRQLLSWLAPFASLLVSLSVCFACPGTGRTHATHASRYASRDWRAAGTLRVLRPLRLISRNEGMKLVVNAMFKAIPAIANVIFVSVLVFLLFAVVGVSFFKGSFNSCQGTNATCVRRAR